MLTWLLPILLALLLLLLAVMLVRTALQMRLPPLPPPLPLPQVDAEVAAGHLAQALRCPTLSKPGEGAAEPAAFEALHRVLRYNYPRLHASLECRRVGRYSLLYRWPGSRPDLAPILLAAHQDVVPAGEEAGASPWSHPPFGGEVAEGFVWGRGALDMKGPLIAIFEAVENLLRADYRPQRTLYLALGEDEECGGLQGAAQIAALLAEEGVTPLAVLDEGGAVVERLIRGVAAPVALIGLAEKGFAVVHLSVSAPPGHAALPGRETAISILSRAIARLESRPFPARLDAIRRLYAVLGAAADAGLQFLMANTWLFAGLLARSLSANPLTRALIRTTAVTTLVRGGIKDNVLPPSAEAWVNCRILPGETIAETLERLRSTIADPRVRVEIVPGAAWPPSPLAPADGPIYQRLQQAILSVYPEALPAPYLMVMASDARYYARLCPHVYRFSPYHLTADELARIHGVDERLSLETLARMVAFYTVLIPLWCDLTET